MSYTVYTGPDVFTGVRADEVAQLRRMVGELTERTYTDRDLERYIKSKPLIDRAGQEPIVYTAVALGLPLTPIINRFWSPTFDINAAAAEIWGEKASALAGLFDYSADGASYSRKQQYDNALARQRFYLARRSARAIKLVPYSIDREEYDIRDI